MNLRLELFVALLSAAALMGCPSEQPPNAAAAPAEQAAATPSVQPAGAARATAAPGPNGGAAAADGTNPRPTLNLTREDIEGMLSQAANVEGDTDCEKAYASVESLMKAMAARVGNRVGSAPDRDQFVQACGALAPEAQRCMVLAYNRAHVAECRGVMAQIPPEAMARMRALTSGRPTAGQPAAGQAAPAQPAAGQAAPAQPAPAQPAH